MNVKLMGLTVLLALGGCSSLDGKTPHEMVNISMQRGLTQDYAYNFVGEWRAFVSDKEKGVLHHAAEQQLLVSNPQKVDSVGKRVTDWVQEYPAVAHYVANGRLVVQGAVDLRAEKLELIPELSMQHRNENSVVRMPMLLDAKDMSITVDLPAMLPLALGFVVEPALRERLIHEPVRLSLADAGKELQHQPMKTVLQAMWVAAYRAYDGIAADQFYLLPLDEFAKESKARYRIGILWNQHNEQAYLKAFKRHFEQEFTRLRQESPEANVRAEDYDKALTATSKQLMAFMSSEEWQQKLFGRHVVRNLYLDGKGRLVGYREYVQIDGKQQAINVAVQLKKFHFNRPTFTFQPQHDKVITFTELWQSIRKETQKK